MVVEKIAIPTSKSLSVLFSPDSSLNPKFFAYGSFPIYLLKFCSSFFPLESPYSNYAGLNLLGRFISALADSLLIIILYKICLLLFSSTKKSLLAVFLYSTLVFPVQLSHFYAVDTLLNLFIFFTLWQSILFYKKQSIFNALFVGIGFGLSLATKISATVLMISISISLLLSLLLSLKQEIFGLEVGFLSKLKTILLKIFSKNFWTTKKILETKNTLLIFSFIIFITIVIFAVSEPFALFDFSTFWRQINEQKVMTKNPYVFPYTLQYVGTMPYFYQFKNIFFWGVGPFISIIAIFGFIYTIFRLSKGLFSSGSEQSEGSQLIIYVFAFIYFITVGNFAIKFMRYCLPLYPVIVIFAANFIIDNFRRFKLIFLLFLLLHLSWLLAFLSIYQKPNTRVLATNWLNQNVEESNLILREHWDDGLPLTSTKRFEYQDLPLYDLESKDKWDNISSLLLRADYLIIASNRLYVPLQKLSDCRRFQKCYPETAKYYQDLFSEKLGYTKVAEFTSYPFFFGLQIDDSSADESFTVYDHPKIMIFKNNAKTPSSMVPVNYRDN